jgi:solute:Na+ symporter, SSS family
MENLPLFDIVVIVVYLLAMILTGFYFSRRNKNPDQFTKASGTIPGWAIGLSIYATFLSSNTFLGVPGKAFGGNWNSFVFSLSMPFAALAASKYFVPFYRNTGEISAYTHLEHRFGPWARTYTVICFLLTQLARMGSIFFGIALSLQSLLGFSMSSIMIVMGICIILYTVFGGIEAVIWTEVVQAVIKTFGALLILFLVIREIPGGVSQIIDIGSRDNKFSLGTISPNFTFGMDQNYVQRYHTAASPRQAARSVWLCVIMYIPASLLFFIIGTALYAYYTIKPELLGGITQADKVLPHFMVTKVPAGLSGLIISAILSAAMSTISSGMNASATVFTVDIYKRYFRPSIDDKKQLFILRISTIVFGLLGLATGIAMIGSKSLLDTWWELSGIFAGGMLGLFLLGIISRRTGSHEAFTAVLLGIMVILWMTFSYALPEEYYFLRNPLNKNMVIVVGTITIFLAGLLITGVKRGRHVEAV